MSGERHTNSWRRLLLSIIWTVCIFGNYQIGDEGSVTVAHIAVLVLSPFALICLLKNKSRPRWKGSRTALVIAILCVTYILSASAIAISRGNPLATRHFGKLVLLLLAVAEYRAIDPEGKEFAFAAWFLPTVYAAALAARFVTLAATGGLTADRLEMPPYSWEVTGYLAGFMLAFLLCAWEQHKRGWRSIALAAVIAINMLGLFLSAVRGALLAITVILFVYVWLSPGAKARKFLYYGAFLVVLSMLSWVYTLGTLGVNAGENRLNVVDVDPTLTGRTVVWLETVDTLLSSRSNFVFGVGLGAVEVFAPEAGGEKDDVFNSLLTAWMNFGLVGLFSYVALLWWFFRRLRRLEMTAQRALLIAMLFGFVCSDMFDTRWQQTFINWFIAYLFYLFSCSWPILAYDSKAARMLKLTAPLRSTP